MTEQDNILRKRFFAFLKENNAYDKWIYNLRHKGWWSVSPQNLYEDNSNEAISRAFFWGDTKEGHEFWSELNHKWSDYRIETMKTGFYD